MIVTKYFPGFPDSGNKVQGNAAKMIERRKFRKKAGENRERAADKTFPPELNLTILHQPSIVSFCG